VAGSLDETGLPHVRVSDLVASGTLMGEPVRLTGSAELHDTTVTTPGLTLESADATVTLEGRGGWQPQPHWDLRVLGEGLDPGRWLPEWPGDLTVAMTSSGRLEADNAVHGELRIERLAGRLAQFTVGARGEALLLGHGLSTPGIGISVDDAHFAATGEAHWAPVPRWDLRVEGRDLDPGLFEPELAGRLTLRGRSEGRLDPDRGIDAFIDVERLEGRLRDYPVSAEGSARIEEGRRLTTPGFQARAGENRIRLEGYAQADAADLRYRVDAPALDILWPGLRGSLHGAGRVAGEWHRPDLDLRLEGTGLGYEAWSLERLSLKASGALEPARPLALEADAEGLAVDDLTLADTVRLAVQGHRDAHRLTLDARTPEGILGLGLDGRITDAPGWSGRIVRLELADTRLEDWRLATPATLSADARVARLAPLCLTRETTRLCLEGERTPVEGLEARLDLADFPLGWLADWLPENIEAEGSLSVAAQLHQHAQGLDLRSRARIGSGELHVLGADGERQSIPFRDVTLDVDKAEGVIQARSGFSFLERGQASAQLALTPEDETYRLDGSARADLRELRWLEVAVPQLRDPEGHLQADLQVSGTLTDPDFRGDLRLTEARLLIPEAGLELTDIRLHAGAEGLDRLALSGGVRSGPGELELSGELGLTPEGVPWANMSLQGERFQAVRRPEARVLVSPDLAMALEARDIRLTGRLTIPEADIELRELPPQAVSVSRDEVIVDAEEPEPPWQVHTEVAVILGERVRLSGFGLTARLAGEVAVEDSPARPVRVEGEIRVEDGRYRAYGQNLIVERGVLIFQGPADNPGLDIRAVRRVPAYNVTAGLAIGGTLQDPRSRVFSTPPMEDSEAMSYLLTGRPLSGASEADANVLAAAIAAFGVEQGGMLTEQIGQAVGLDEFTLDSEGDVDQSALMMGKHLSSRLYLRYTVGLFERASSLMLRYTLTRSLSLETRTSDEAQSVDLIYRLER
jgi:translocation and assembly module TamB